MIYVDLDSTLTNNIYAWIDFINNKNNTKYTIQDIKKFDDPLLLRNIEFIKTVDYKDVKLLSGAKEFINSLKTIDEVCILTITVKKEFIKQKKDFVKKYFPETKLIQVKDNKHLYIKNNDFLIDDRLETIEKLPIKNGIVFNNNEYQYNKTSKYFQGGYNEILEYLSKLKKK